MACAPAPAACAERPHGGLRQKQSTHRELQHHVVLPAPAQALRLRTARHVQLAEHLRSAAQLGQPSPGAMMPLKGALLPLRRHTLP